MKSAGFMNHGEGLTKLSTAECTLNGGGLTVRADGAEGSIALVAVPVGCDEYEELAGVAWEPGRQELSGRADVLTEGGISVRGEEYVVHAITVRCTSYVPESMKLSVEVSAEVEGPSGGYSDLTAYLSCTPR